MKKRQLRSQLLAAALLQKTLLAGSLFFDSVNWKETSDQVVENWTLRLYPAQFLCERPEDRPLDGADERPEAPPRAGEEDGRL